MKETKREVTAYEAMDGTIFNDKNECAIYERSALCIVKSKFTLKKVEDERPFKFIFMDGCGDDYLTYIFEPKKQEEVDAFLQYLEIHSVGLSHLSDDVEPYRRWLRFEEIVPDKKYVVFLNETCWCGVSTKEKLLEAVNYAFGSLEA